jgi:hypothetical protein
LAYVGDCVCALADDDELPLFRDWSDIVLWRLGGHGNSVYTIRWGESAYYHFQHRYQSKLQTFGIWAQECVHYALFKINSRQPKILQMDLAGFRLAAESRFGEVVSNRD